MNKIAPIMVDEMQYPWKYGQTFHPSSIKRNMDFQTFDCTVDLKLIYLKIGNIMKPPCTKYHIIWSHIYIYIYIYIHIYIYRFWYLNCERSISMRTKTSCPHPLGHSGVDHAPLFSMTVPVGSCLEASLAAHLYLFLGAVYLSSWREFQSARWWVYLLIVAILFHSVRRGE